MTTSTLEARTVAGLEILERPGTGPTVVGLAGLGSSGWAWEPLAERMPDIHLVAPSLRGRGGSQHHTGPTGLSAHARDVAAVVTELGLHDVVLVGHSMGAYLAPLVAKELGDRVRHLVLVDGGIRPALPFFLRPALTRMAFRKQLRATDRPMADVQEYARKGRLGSMIGSRTDLEPTLMRMLERELGGTPGALRPRLDVARAVEDAVDCFHGPSFEPALDALTVPAYVLLAENKKKDGQRPFITDKAVAPWVARQPLLKVQRLKGNHVTVLFAPEVEAAVRA